VLGRPVHSAYRQTQARPRRRHGHRQGDGCALVGLARAAARRARPFFLNGSRFRV